MKKVFAFTALLLTAALPSAFAQNLSVGTWKMDTAQSDFGPRPKPKSATLVITKDTPQMLAWHEREMSADGKPSHESWSGPEDGSMHTLKHTGGNGEFGISGNSGNYTIHEKMADGTTSDATVTRSDDGSTMTEYITGKDKSGQPFTATIVWRKVHGTMHAKHKTM